MGDLDEDETFLLQKLREVHEQKAIALQEPHEWLQHEVIAL